MFNFDFTLTRAANKKYNQVQEARKTAFRKQKSNNYIETSVKDFIVLTLPVAQRFTESRVSRFEIIKSIAK